MSTPHLGDSNLHFTRLTPLSLLGWIYFILPNKKTRFSYFELHTIKGPVCDSVTSSGVVAS